MFAKVITCLIFLFVMLTLAAIVNYFVPEYTTWGMSEEDEDEDDDMVF